MLAGKGDLLPVSAFTPDGTWPTGTAKWEKRNIADAAADLGQEPLHPVQQVRVRLPPRGDSREVLSRGALAGSPEGFESVKFRGGPNQLYTIQVAPEDCTGCTLCVAVCPAKDKTNASHKALNMAVIPERDKEIKQYEFFLALPNPDRKTLKPEVKSSQFAEPLFEYSGACAGCGETPYLKLLTQLYGDRLVIANATGCSSIYGGNLPTTPYTTDCNGRGPAWSNSLFEDNAEYGLGFRFGIDKHAEIARQLVRGLAPQIGDEAVKELLEARSAERGGNRPTARAGRTIAQKHCRTRHCGRAPAGIGRRLPGSQERLDRRRRRLGLRHRVRRHGSCPLDGGGCEHPRPGHGGLLEHRGPDVQSRLPSAPRQNSPSRARLVRKKTSDSWR